VRNIIKSWTDRRRVSMTLWSGKLPRPRTSPAMTLGDCAATILRGRRSVVGGTLAEALGRSPFSSSARTMPIDRVQIQKLPDPFSLAAEQCHAPQPDLISSAPEQCHARPVASARTGYVPTAGSGTLLHPDVGRKRNSAIHKRTIFFAT
jgi:hypothetical protein